MVVHKIRIENFNFSYENKSIIKDLSINIFNKEFITILGPSGCGKSTLLHSIAGFLIHEKDMIKINSKNVDKVVEDMRIVFQDYPLLKWKTLEQNVRLSINNMSKKKKIEITSRYLKEVGLCGYENYYPYQLSGGMAQRGALATAFAAKPKLLLMDEPFGALDALTKKKMQKTLLNIWEKNKTTIVMITHDIEEAILLSDRIIILSQRPATILKEFEIIFNRPREENIIYTKEFTQMKKNIMNYLK